MQYCATVTADPTRRYCNAIVHTMQIAQPRVGLAAAGGNPVPGASSTLGMKLGAVPRVSFGARVTSVKLEAPGIDAITSNNDIDARMNAIQLDASVGIFSGFSLLPTVGGFGSLDLVVTLGRVSMPDDHDFPSDVTNWGLGARLGLLRESFTAPGVSITGMYRGLGDIQYGDRNSATPQAFFELGSPRMLSLRGVVGKRIVAIGVMAGIGYDRITSDASFGTTFLSLPPAQAAFAEDGFKTSRTAAFASAQWTLLILSVVGEAGWQLGGDEFTAPLPTGHESMTENKPFFFSLALRLSI